MLDNRSNDNAIIVLTARIVAAYVVKHRVATAQLRDLIEQTHMRLQTLGQTAVAVEEPEKLTPPVSIRKSIQHDYLVCLEDGQQFKSLRRHLMSKYRMTAEQYREKWDLPKDYPMVAPAYAAKRSEMAKKIGLGTMRKGRPSAAKVET